MGDAKPAKSHHTPLPGVKQATMHLPIALLDRMKAVQAARARSQGSTPRLSAVYKEILELGLERLDGDTGFPRPLPPIPKEPAAIARFPAHLPLFSEYVDCNQFADRADLFRVMDASWMMLWAAGPENNCVHVNPTLEKYTGLPREQFLQLGWTEVLHADDRASTVQVCRRGFELRKSFRMAYRMRRWDGLHGWIIDFAQPRSAPDGGEFGYVGTMYQVFIAEQVHGTPLEALFAP